MTLLSSSTFSMKLINQWGIIEKWKEAREKKISEQELDNLADDERESEEEEDEDLDKNDD